MQPDQTDTERLARTADGRLDLDALLALSREEQVEALAPQPAAGCHGRPERVRWALANLPGSTCCHRASASRRR